MAETKEQFMKRATKVTSFNLTSKDFTILDYKKYIQELYSSYMFNSFNPKDALDSLDINQFNNLVKLLKKDNLEQFRNLHSLSLKGIGPGEATLFLLTKYGKLGGGTSAGQDLIMQNVGYEIKACDYYPYSNETQVYNLKLGGTISGMTKLESDIQELAYRLNITTQPHAAEISASKFKDMKKLDPIAYNALEKRYQDLAFSYFQNHETIFILNTKNAQRFGEIIALKKIQKADISMERYTSKSLKPIIKIK